MRLNLSVLNSLHWEVREGQNNNLSWVRLRTALYRWKDLWEDIAEGKTEMYWARQGYKRLVAPEIWWLTMLLVEVEVGQTATILPVAAKAAAASNDFKNVHNVLLVLEDLTV
jgi:hypothetical protein